MSNLTKCLDCGAMMNPSWGKCLACQSPQNQVKATKENPIIACGSVHYSLEAGLQNCGPGWTCQKCQGTGNDLKTVYFWSERLQTMLDLTLPEKNLYDYNRVMEARHTREKETRKCAI